MKHLFRLLPVLLFFLVFFAKPAWAYLDPGSGSFIAQIIIGFFVGGFTVLKSFREAAINIVKKLFKKEKKG